MKRNSVLTWRRDDIYWNNKQTTKWRCLSHVLDRSINKKEQEQGPADRILSLFPFLFVKTSAGETNKNRTDDKGEGKNKEKNKQTNKMEEQEDFPTENVGRVYKKSDRSIVQVPTESVKFPPFFSKNSAE